LLRTSLQHADGGKEAYQRLAATAWPIRAMIEIHRPKEAAQTFAAVAGLADDVQPSPSRAEAVFLVYQATLIGGPELSSPAFESSNPPA